MKALIITCIAVSSAFSCFAALADPVANCKEGRATSSAGYANLEAQGPSHVLLNSTRQYSGDSNWSLQFEYIDFYLNSQYLGDDEANLEGNAYKNITFSQLGLNKVFAVFSFCSFKKVWVQREPSLNIDLDLIPNYREDGTKSYTFVDFRANVWVDQYSKVGIENDVPSTKWYTRGSQSVDWQLISESDSLSGNYYGGVAYFKVVLDDGTFKDVEEFYIQPSEPALGASPCAAKPWLCEDNDL